jgi:hypothetical protein
MLNSETSLRTKSSAIGPSETSSQLQVITYIRDMASELQAMSEKSGLAVTAHLLSMTVLAAEEISESIRSGHPPATKQE